MGVHDKAFEQDLTMLHTTDDDRQKLRETFKGWTIESVRYPSLDELIGEFVLVKDDKKKIVRLFATELGFWLRDENGKIVIDETEMDRPSKIVSKRRKWTGLKRLTGFFFRN